MTLFRTRNAHTRTHVQADSRAQCGKAATGAVILAVSISLVVCLRVPAFASVSDIRATDWATRGAVDSAYWYGAQQGILVAVSIGTPGLTLRYQRFGGTYVADAPTFYSVEWERVTVGRGSLYVGLDRVAWGAPFSTSFEGFVYRRKGGIRNADLGRGDPISGLRCSGGNQVR